MNVIITKDHWLEIDGKPVKRQLIPGGAEMASRRFLVHHYTEGADIDGDTDGDGKQDSGSLLEILRERGLSVHLGIDRDGTVIQYRPFNRTCGHAGGRGMSIWIDPKTGESYTGNEAGIGIEFGNAGTSAGAQSWARKHGATLATGRNRDGSESVYECFTAEAIAVGLAVSVALCKRYNLDDVTGHREISSWRKFDPGPKFPMLKIRKACGFDGPPRCFSQSGKLIAPNHYEE
jgi:N-acetylmuramoyl-L-alanine amidase